MRGPRRIVHAARQGFRRIGADRVAGSGRCPPSPTGPSAGTPGRPRPAVAAPDAPPWGVLVSEVMLQQTRSPGSTPAYEEWLRRWPTPAAWPPNPPARRSRPGGGSATRGGRCGCTSAPPRSRPARRQVPADRRRPARPARHRRLHRPCGGGLRLRAAPAGGGHQRAAPGGPGRQRPPRRRAGDHRGRPAAVEALLPADAGRGPPGPVPRSWNSARWSAPPANRACGACPLRPTCAWQRRPASRVAGRPTPRRSATRAPTGRPAASCWRSAGRPPDGVPRPPLDAAWPDAEQRDRALSGLSEDGLIVGHRRRLLRAAGNGRGQLISGRDPSGPPVGARRCARAFCLCRGSPPRPRWPRSAASGGHRAGPGCLDRTSAASPGGPPPTYRRPEPERPRPDRPRPPPAARDVPGPAAEVRPRARHPSRSRCRTPRARPRGRTRSRPPSRSRSSPSTTA